MTNEYYITCPLCKGSGKDDDEDTCVLCEGTTVVPHSDEPRKRCEWFD